MTVSTAGHILDPVLITSRYIKVEPLFPSPTPTTFSLFLDCLTVRKITSSYCDWTVYDAFEGACSAMERRHVSHNLGKPIRLCDFRSFTATAVLLRKHKRRVSLLATTSNTTRTHPMDQDYTLDLPKCLRRKWRVGILHFSLFNRILSITW